MTLDRNDARVTTLLASLQQIGNRVRTNEASPFEAYAATLILRDKLQCLGWDTALAGDGFTVVLREHKQEEEAQP